MAYLCVTVLLHDIKQNSMYSLARGSAWHVVLPAKCFACKILMGVHRAQVARGGRAKGGKLELLGFEAIPAGLDLVEAGDQITHLVRCKVIGTCWDLRPAVCGVS